MNTTSLKTGQSVALTGTKNVILLKCWISNSESNGVTECILPKGVNSFSNLHIGYSSGTNLYVNLIYENNIITVTRIYAEGYWEGISTICLMAYTL